MIEVRDNHAASRFEADVEGQLAVADYQIVKGTIVFSHTEVPRALQGRGIASALIRAALESARKQGLKLVPACSFVRRYMETHPETQDLLAR
ncbi:MAG: GNAT family N-acetyltransferase [Steroidobacteraceae bacterium]